MHRVLQVCGSLKSLKLCLNSLKSWIWYFLCKNAKSSNTRQVSIPICCCVTIFSPTVQVPAPICLPHTSFCFVEEQKQTTVIPVALFSVFHTFVRLPPYFLLKFSHPLSWPNTLFIDQTKSWTNLDNWCLVIKKQQFETPCPLWSIYTFLGSSSCMFSFCG